MCVYVLLPNCTTSHPSRQLFHPAYSEPTCNKILLHLTIFFFRSVSRLTVVSVLTRSPFTCDTNHMSWIYTCTALLRGRTHVQFLFHAVFVLWEKNNWSYYVTMVCTCVHELYVRVLFNLLNHLTDIDGTNINITSLVSSIATFRLISYN